MHEFSIAKELVDNLLAEAQKNNIVKVLKVDLQIGEVAFIHPDQLVFSYDILKKDTPILQDSQLVISKQELVVNCQSCDYQGGVEYEDNPYHFIAPLLRCPKCGSGVDILQGRDCVIKNIDAEVEDDGE